MAGTEMDGGNSFSARLMGWHPKGFSGSAYTDAAWEEFHRLGKKLTDDMRRATPVSPAKAMQIGPGMAGHMRDTVKLVEDRSKFTMQVRVGDEVNYLGVVIRGYPGRIYPVQAQALRFVGYDGTLVFAKSVAGQTANPFNERVRDQSREEIAETSRKMQMAVARKFGENFH